MPEATATKVTTCFAVFITYVIGPPNGSNPSPPTECIAYAALPNIFNN